MKFRAIYIRAFICLSLLLSATACSVQKRGYGRTDAPLSLRVVQSETARCPVASELDFLQGKLKWNYTTGLELKSFLDVYERYGGDSIYRYAEEWYDAMIADDGSIRSYKLTNFSTDHVCPGNALFLLYEKSGKAKYKMAMDTLRKQLSLQPRTPEGGFWHKRIYPEQMWLDGLYMAQPFYARYTSLFEADSAKEDCYADIMRQFLIAAKHTYDPATGLYRHAWDSSRKMFWSDPATGQSAHSWGRAMGWFCMAIVDALPYVPESTPGRDSVLAILGNIYEVLPKYADPKSGMWYQVLDCPGREGNYVESTASAMFVYAMLKGIRLGYLPGKLKPYADKSYKALLDTFVSENPDGTLSLEKCCAVAGLGGKDMRSGDYNYYIGEAVRDNDPKGIGPLIWAALEKENANVYN